MQNSGTLTLNGAKQQLPARPCFRCVIEAKTTNAAIVNVGSVVNQSHELSPGESVTLTVQNLDEVYVRGTADDVISVLRWS